MSSWRFHSCSILSFQVILPFSKVANSLEFLVGECLLGMRATPRADSRCFSYVMEQAHPRWLEACPGSCPTTFSLRFSALSLFECLHFWIGWFCSLLFQWIVNSDSRLMLGLSNCNFHIFQSSSFPHAFRVILKVIWVTPAVSEVALTLPMIRNQFEPDLVLSLLQGHQTGSFLHSFGRSRSKVSLDAGPVQLERDREALANSMLKSDRDSNFLKFCLSSQ